MIRFATNTAEVGLSMAHLVAQLRCAKSYVRNLLGVLFGCVNESMILFHSRSSDTDLNLGEASLSPRMKTAFTLNPRYFKSNYDETNTNVVTDVPNDIAINNEVPFFRKYPLFLEGKVHSKCRTPKFEMLSKETKLYLRCFLFAQSM